MNSRLLLTGIGLRTPHFTEVLEKRPGTAWLEVHSENFFGDGGKALNMLERIRQHYPVSLHGVNLSLGSADELNWSHLKKLRDLIDRINPCLISDHLCWSSINGQYIHDLLPLPYTEEAVTHVVARIQQVQEFLRRQILIENISSYVQFTQSTLTEQDFIREVVKKSGCGILLDINNIYVSSANLGYNPEAFLQTIPVDHVQEIHLAGFSSTVINGREILIDSHDRAVIPAVWDLFRLAIQYLGRKPTIIEWDSNLPALETLCLEAYRAETILRETYVPAKRTG
ncbi:hypothetical protein AQUSIP_26050 [Aquicella siphonis]|uniref:UPF0276 protein AQUSIP_26050 n=1 Tax=Aquicella siphonis TaxID=254247 RepID=A0A5E4PL52_9COXI|nr:DUF692 domain-containing protein [Aquicella siphonis]VVC77278.1 hypothetical protein AQUSIP_26050 [Aquicella siphonis]